MMNCSCRTAALRLFVRNVTSIQVPADFAAARYAARTHSATTTSSLLASIEGQRTTGAFRNLQQSRSLHMTAARPNAAEGTSTAPDPSPSEINNKNVLGEDDEAGTPVLNSRKLRKIRRQEEKRKLKEAEAEAKAKAIAGRKEKAKTRAAKLKGKPPKKNKKSTEATKSATDAADATDAPKSTDLVEMSQEQQPQKKQKIEKKAKTHKPKKAGEASEDPHAKNKERKEKPWEVEKKRKGGEKKKQEEEARLKNLQPWQIQKKVLKEKFPEGWKPMKKMSPDAMAGIRALHRQFPDTYTTEVLAQKFEMSPEAIRRILKSKWEEKDETPDIDVKRQERWFQRGKSVWARYAAMGKKPPRKWRAEGIVRHPRFNMRRGDVRPQHFRRGGSVRAIREAYGSRQDREDRDQDPEAARQSKERIARRQHRRSMMTQERKLLREASENLLKGFF